jgi:hypothetical protein
MPPDNSWLSASSVIGLVTIINAVAAGGALLISTYFQSRRLGRGPAPPAGSPPGSDTESHKQAGSSRTRLPVDTVPPGE